MEEHILESMYPLYFRKNDAAILGKEIQAGHSTIIIGMKRVGISNFLKFFIYHKQINSTYLSQGGNHLFIPVNLNDLVEREVFPFWILFFKRILDAITPLNIKPEIKQEIENLFLQSIQLNDQFLLIENIRESLAKIIAQKVIPTVFLIRFDRMQKTANDNLFNNLRGLQDFLHNQVSFILTCYRPLTDLLPDLDKTSFNGFTKTIYFLPSTPADQKILLETSALRYGLTLSEKEKNELLELSGGHVRLLQLMLILRHEKPILKKTSLLEHFFQDERILLQAEELWESLTPKEQLVLKNITANKPNLSEIETNKYLSETGFIIKHQNKYQIFSSLFKYYIQKKTSPITSVDTIVEFTKKELALFKFLQQYLNQVCERDRIITAVWTDEEEALEVSDWAIDRLVARVRAKLKTQKSNQEILTIRTRGYKLIQQ